MNNKYNNKKLTPAYLTFLNNLNITNNNKTKISMAGIINVINLAEIFIGLIKEGIAATTNMFEMLLPIRLPTKISFRFFFTEIIVTVNSGNVVPNDNKLTAITPSVILVSVARFCMKCTTKRAEIARTIMLIII